MSIQPHMRRIALIPLPGSANWTFGLLLRFAPLDRRITLGRSTSNRRSISGGYPPPYYRNDPWQCDLLNGWNQPEF